MNLRYLGDALDHWKGSLFENLQQADLLRNFTVDPMATDADDWQPSDFALFARLLRVGQNQIINHRRSLALDRSGYMREIEHRGDIFLDPDTGIATSRVKNISQYVRPAEIHDLLNRQQERVVAVYQHIRAQKTRSRLEAILSILKSIDQPLACCSYESSTVAMLFFARNRGRVDDVYECHSSLLGRHAALRISRWHA